MTKQQIKKLAKLWVANVSYHALGTADGSKLLTDEEYEKFSEEVNALSNKLLRDANIPTEALFIGALDNLIEYVRK
jgi:hypothetical protein